VAKQGEPSPVQTARMNRTRIAAEEGAKALGEAAKKAADIRKNMERLRALRLAKEASGIQQQIAASNAAPKAKSKKRVR